MNRRFTWILLVVAAGATLLFLLAMCGRPSRGSAKDSPDVPVQRVRVMRVERGDVERALEATGEIVATNRVTISSALDGPITYFPWREGDVVARQGDLLVRIDRATYEAEARAAESALRVAQARLEDLRAGARPEEVAQAREAVRHLEEAVRFAGADRERISSLVEIGALAPEAREKADVTFADQNAQLESARQRLHMLESGPTRTELAVQEALVAQAEAGLQLARARLAESAIAAPFAGVVSKTFVRAGDMAAARAPLLELFDPGSLVVRFSVPERVAAAVRDSMRLTLHLDAAPDEAVPARVVRVYPELDARTRTRVLEAVPSSPVAMMPAMFVRIRLVLESATDVAVIPAAAVATDPNGQSVAYTVDNGLIRIRPLEVGLEEEERVAVVDGLTPGEQVVVGGLGKLKDGARVEAAEEKQQSVHAAAGGTP